MPECSHLDDLDAEPNVLDLLLLSLAISASTVDEVEVRLDRLSLGGGPVAASQVDRRYSPLIFSGLQGSIGATYTRARGRTERVFSLEYATGPLHSRHGRRLSGTSVSWLVTTLYPLGEGDAFSWGGANNNQFNRRRIEGFLNYDGRTDYFTAVGPAARYAQSFRLLNQAFDVQVLGHLQVFGFYIPSGYVSSMPRGFGYEQNGPLAAALGSAFVFHPGSALNFGLRPELWWQVGENSRFGASYLYDFTALRHVHPSRWSRGTVMLSLNVGI